MQKQTNKKHEYIKRTTTKKLNQTTNMHEYIKSVISFAFDKF